MPGLTGGKSTCVNKQDSFAWVQKRLRERLMEFRPHLIGNIGDMTN